jgi:superoxide dismutase, Cu-Zn family
MEKKTMLAGVLGLGALGTLGLAGVLAHPGHDTAGQATVRIADVAARVTGSPSPVTGTNRGHVRVTLRDGKGRTVARVDITALRHGGNQVSVSAWDLTPGFHGIHLHAVGVCDPGGAKPFASAGGHFNPTGTAEGMQAGAFPVLLAGADGRAQATFVDGAFTIRDLYTASGTAIVIHALPDNYANVPTRYASNGMAGPDTETQTTGDAGTRIACGVVAAPARATTPASPSMSGMPGMAG